MDKPQTTKFGRRKYLDLHDTKHACQATTLDGDQCKRLAWFGDKYCMRHTKIMEAKKWAKIQ